MRNNNYQTNPKKVHQINRDKLIYEVASTIKDKLIPKTNNF